jgi:hypothetical protein
MPPEPALLWLAGLPPVAVVGWVACRLISTFCAAWLERSRRKTRLATMDKAGQVLLALERERRKGVGRDGRINRHRLPATGAEPVSSELTRKVNG